MRFVLRYYTERLNDLEQSLAYEAQEAKTKRESAERLRKFLANLGYEFALEIQATIDVVQTKIVAAEESLRLLRKTHETNTHFTDDLRQKLRNFSDSIDRHESAIASLDEFIVKERSLRDEIFSIKFRLKRLGTASSILSEVEFAECPHCGTELASLSRQFGECVLCAAPGAAAKNVTSTTASPDQTDLDARLSEIEESLALRIRARAKQGRQLEELVDEKRSLDDRLKSRTSHIRLGLPIAGESNRARGRNPSTGTCNAEARRSYTGGAEANGRGSGQASTKRKRIKARHHT